MLLTDANAPVLKDKDLAAIGPDVLGTIKHYRKNVNKVCARSNLHFVTDCWDLQSGQSGNSSTIATTSKATLDKAKDSSKIKDTAKGIAEKDKSDSKRKASNAELDSTKASKSASSSKAASPAATNKDKGKEKAAPSKSSGPSLDDLFKSDATTKNSTTNVTSKLGKQPSAKVAADDDFDSMLADDDDMMAEIDGVYSLIC